MRKWVAAIMAAACCLFVALAKPAAADETASTKGTFSLTDAIAAAGLDSPVNDLAEAGVEAAVANRKLAGLRPNPSFSIEAENVLGTGNYAGLQALETSGTLSWPIELGGKRSARISVADAQSARALIEAEILRADLKLAITDAYIDAVTAESRVANAFEQARIAGEVRRAADVRVRAGAASPIEIQRADVAKINADTLLSQARREVEVSRLRLGSLIGRPVSGTLDSAWLSDVPAGYGPLAPVDSTGTLTRAAADADLLTADAQLRLARAQRLPDLTVGSGVRRFESGEGAFLFSVTVPLPIFNNGRAAEQQAGALRLQAEARQRVTAVEVDNAILSVQAEAANAAMRAGMATGPALAAAEETARIARIGYREGKFGQLDLLDAERTLAETRNAAIEALAEYHRAQARFERLIAPAPVQGNNR